MGIVPLPPRPHPAPPHPGCTHHAAVRVPEQDSMAIQECPVSPTLGRLWEHGGHRVRIGAPLKHLAYQEGLCSPENTMLRPEFEENSAQTRNRFSASASLLPRGSRVWSLRKLWMGCFIFPKAHSVLLASFNLLARPQSHPGG